MVAKVKLGGVARGHSGDELVEKISRYKVFDARGNVDHVAVGTSVVVFGKVHDE